jgi:hypothetical protein
MNIVVDEWSNYEKRLEAKATARERRRIRRAQAKALKLIRSPNSGMTRDYYADIIEQATRAPRKGKR